VDAEQATKPKAEPGSHEWLGEWRDEHDVAPAPVHIRFARGAELKAMQADRDRYQAEHPEDVEKGATMRAVGASARARRRPRKPLAPRVCELESCGQEFVPRTHWQKFCCPLCAGRVATARAKRRAEAAA
jgi:predicted RNA-binding Zn-ribbon protein involved in translation (DUF1610 family)